ncbi:MAG TPA: deaminase [Anaerolineaceae bacterium]|nr:deaminase [Anaerolineaceae bacterium]
MRCSVFIATSLDGFIARSDGDFSWLDSSAPQIEGEDFGFAEFYSSVDALVMGRKTYETALGFSEWPYAGKRVVVLSSSSILIPQNLEKDVEHINASPGEVIQQLELTGARYVYVDGGLTIQGFLKAGLINEMTITTIPILLGSGIPLFGPLDQDIQLQLITSRAYPNGFVQTKYRIYHSKLAD